MKKYIILVLTMLGGCVWLYSASLKMTNESSKWLLKSSPAITVVESKEFPDLSMKINFTSTLYGYGLSAEDCNGKYKYKNVGYIIDVQIINNTRDFDVRYFFNPAKFYFRKNGINYPLEGYDMFDPHYKAPNEFFDITGLWQLKKKFVLSYKSPLVCGELEDVEFVMDGFAVQKENNSEPTLLEPIKLRFNFDKPRSVPLYEK